MEKDIRVRFAPSPTGGLHIGGIRTVLYDYLFAKKHNGKFILRIEDTDQARFVPGAEEYIFDTLSWCGLTPDESVLHGGEYGPYRQSDRKPIYKQYAEALVANGHAYYAFDTSEEIEAIKKQMATEQNPNPQYDAAMRLKMKNSLTLPAATVEELLNTVPYVVRIKMPEGETIALQDLIRGDVSFNTSLLDDKVLLKSDAMPTYHLAVVVDDYLMKISHVFRGEEWLPSAPVHILLWKYLFGLEKMPQWAHLPLILGPEGKLSKRDGAKYGFPVFASSWLDPKTQELTEGFKEKGFMPEAFINMLAMLGWNDGTDKEIFSIEELIESFSIERVHSSGAKFDYEKALWFNHEWIKHSTEAYLLPLVKKYFPENTSDEKAKQIIGLVKDRCKLLTGFEHQAGFFFAKPVAIDTDSIKPKWTETKKDFFVKLIVAYQNITDWSHTVLDANFNALAADMQLKTGEVMMPFRIMLVGGKFGPGVFDIAALLEKTETIERIENGILAIEKH